MRWMRFTLPLLLLISPLAFGQKQYTEGACLLLQHQMVQFSAQPNSHNYQSAKREFNNHCQNPRPVPVKDLVLINIPAKPASAATQKNITLPAATTRSALSAQPKVPTDTKLQPAAGFDLGAMMFSLFAPYIPYMIGGTLLLMLPGIFILLLFGNQARFLGAIAERSLYKQLLRKLPISYRHYRNLVLQTAQGDLTEVDHLIVSPYGIFVIEVKNYQGWIFGGEKQTEWTVQHFRRKHRFMNPLRQNFKHTEAVKHTLGLDKTDAGKVYSIVAFGPRAEFKTPLPANVLHIDQVADYLPQFYQFCFSDDELKQLNAKLNMALDAKKQLSKLHMQQVTTKT
jgi:hypothetical protein